MTGFEAMIAKVPARDGHQRGEWATGDLVAMMSERGIALAHTTILRLVQYYTPDFEKRWNRTQVEEGYPKTPASNGR